MSYIPPTIAGWTSQRFGTFPGGYNPPGGHTGEDIAVPVGTPLVAMAEGIVVHVGYFQGSYSDNPWWIQPSFAGFVVSIDYGDYISHYAHCSRSPVLSGQRVQQGQIVAYSGNTGTATSGPHLHWEVMRNGWNLQNSTYGRINPRSVTSSNLALSGTYEAIVTKLKEQGVALELKDLEAIQDIVQTERDTIVNEVRAQGAHVLNELTKKLADNTYEIKIFTQAVDNANTDRAIIDNRAIEGDK